MGAELKNRIYFMNFSIRIEFIKILQTVNILKEIVIGRRETISQNPFWLFLVDFIMLDQNRYLTPEAILTSILISKVDQNHFPGI